MCKSACKKYDCRCECDLTGKVAIVTGCNTGIGLETVKALYAKNCKVYMACRNADKANAAKDVIIAEITDKNPNNLVFLQLDLTKFTSVRKFVAEFNQREKQLHILLNNAGVVTKEHQLSEDGLEVIFQANHFGHFLLTNELLDVLKASAPSRIINVASMGHGFCKGDAVLKGFIEKNEWDGFDRGLGQYCRTKMAQVLHTLYMAPRLAGTGVTFNVLHPGEIQTQMTDGHWSNAWYGFFYRNVVRPMQFVDVHKGSQCNIHLAVCPELAAVTGKYFSKVEQANPKNLDAGWEARAEKLYKESLRLCGIETDALVDDGL